MPTIPSRTWPALCVLLVIAAGPSSAQFDATLLGVLESTGIEGYVSTSGIWRLGAGNVTPGRSFDGADKQDGFNLDVVNLTLVNDLAESGWAAGYRLELLFGPDASTYDTLSDLDADPADLAIKEAKVMLRVPAGRGLDLSLGVWEKVIGFEAFDYTDNPNFSRSYGYYLAPQQHTGLLATYPLADGIVAAAGVANHGWDVREAGGEVIYDRRNNVNLRREPGDPDDGTLDDGGPLTYTGALKVTLADDAALLPGAMIFAGVTDSGVGGAPDALNLAAGGTFPLVSNLWLGLAWDHRSNGEGAGVPEAAAWSTAGYLIFQATPRLNLTARGDLAQGDSSSWGYADERNRLFGLTMTTDYTLWSELTTRCEVRWDTERDGRHIFGEPDDLDSDAVSITFNAIYPF